MKYRMTDMANHSLSEYDVTNAIYVRQFWYKQILCKYANAKFHTHIFK